MVTPDITVQITADTAGAKAAASTREAFALLPAPPAQHGPGAARQIAEQIAATGLRSCLVADGGHVCLGRPCNAPAPTLAEVLL